jgi:hypothetical protein
VENAQHLALRPQVELAGGFCLRDLRVQRRPLRTALAAFEAEADLQAAAPSVARLRVDRHVAGMNFLVAQLAGPGGEHLEVVVPGQSGNIVGPGNAHLVFGALVVRRQIRQRDGPVE